MLWAHIVYGRAYLRPQPPAGTGLRMAQCHGRSRSRLLLTRGGFAAGCTSYTAAVQPRVQQWSQHRDRWRLLQSDVWASRQIATERCAAECRHIERWTTGSCAAHQCRQVTRCGRLTPTCPTDDRTEHGVLSEAANAKRSGIRALSSNVPRTHRTTHNVR